MLNARRGLLAVYILPVQLFFMVLVLAAGSGQVSAQSGCSCTNCPQFMPDNFQGNFYIQVQNASNPTLGQNGQGVCGVTLNFQHDYVGDLTITLTSPAGQTVTLMDPVGLFGETDGTTWDITFVPCSDPANPDPGFTEIWSNNQNWGLFGFYTGSYYPYSGCLEDFNSGPVNGQWNLTVTDGQGNDVGNFYDYSIIFCDPTGIECTTCEANAGNLLQADVTGCEGDPALSLSLPPTYVAPQTPPPSGEYSYTYVIASGSLIVAYNNSPDLSGFPAGSYTVCGLSYLSSDAGEIPAPNGVLTIAQLASQLNSPTPPFCGKITSNCVNVNILPALPNVTDTAMVCAPDCYEYYGELFCTQGAHSVTVEQDGCSFTATLHLSVLPSAGKTIFETICPGACSQTPGFENYCDAGTYTLSLEGANGCDSLVSLNLNLLQVDAVIVPPQPLSCTQQELLLQSTGSSMGPNASYLWSASNGGEFVGPIDQATATVVSAGSYTLVVCKTGGGASCCDTASVDVQAIALDSLPAPDSLYADILVCLGDTSVYLVLDSIGASSFLWELPASASNWSASANKDTLWVVWQTIGRDSICVRGANSCDTSAAICFNVERIQIPTPLVVSGPDTICAGAEAFYELVGGMGASSYSWKITGGTLLGKSDTTAIRVAWDDQAGQGRVCALALNACGVSPEHCLEVQLLPTVQTFVGPDTAVCGTEHHLTVMPSQGGQNSHWRVISGNGNAVFSDSLLAQTTVSVSKPGIYLFEWREENIACFSSDSVEIQFNAIPSAVIDSVACDAANEFYQLEFSLSGGLPPYLANGILVNGNSYQSSPVASGGMVQILFSDLNGCQFALSDSFTCNCVTKAGFMNEDVLEICSDQNGKAQHLGGQILDGNDTSIYILHTSSDSILGQIIDQNNTGVFSFKTGMHYDSVYYISLVAGNKLNGLPDPSDPCLSVAKGQPIIFRQIPIVYAGVDTAICGATLNLHANTTNGYWEFLNTASTGGTIYFADSQNSKTSIEATLPGTYSMTWKSSNYGCIGSDTVNVTFYENPDWSELDHICDSTNENYTLQLNVSGGALPYSVNNNAILGTTFQTAPIPSGASYDFQIADANNCLAPAISGSFACNCSTASGAMSVALLYACAGDSVTAASNGTFVLDGNDTLAYVLHTSPGTNLGQILAQNHSGVFGFRPGMIPDSVYYISLVVGNNLNGFPDPADPCLSVALGQPVIFSKPPSPQAGTSKEFCGLSIALAADAGGYPGTWSMEEGPGAAAFESLSSPFSGVEVSMPGNYIFRWTETNGACIASDTVSITFFETPEIDQIEKICIGTNSAYTLIFNVIDGLPPYVVDGLGGALTGNSFLSALLPNNSIYSFSITDANGCKTPEISGTHGCACTTYAGSMETNLEIFCSNQPAVAQWNNDAKLDADDLIQFILHDQAGSVPGNVLAVNDQPVFSYSPNLQTGATYYISAIAGNDDGGSVNHDDPCFSVSPGTPIKWKQLPSATLSGDTAVCEGQEVILQLSGSGDFPLKVIYKDGAGQSFSTLLSDQQSIGLSISPAQSTSITLLSVSDGSAPVCSQQLGDIITIEVQKKVEAGMVISTLDYCFGDTATVQLEDMIVGEDAGGSWMNISPIPLDSLSWNPALGNLKTQTVPVGNYTFQYLLSGQPLCPDDSTSVHLVIRPRPTVHAGLDVFLDCMTPSALLQGTSGTNPGQLVEFQWTSTDNTQVLSDSLNLVVDKAGQYVLEGINSWGCFARDTAAVEFLGIPLSQVTLQVLPIHCFGEHNGRILIDTVFGGTPPVLFSLNGSPFGNTTQFRNLGPGKYELIAQDAAGCEWTEVVVLTEPDEIKIDLGPDIQAALGDSVYLSLQSSVPASALDTVIWQPLLDSTATGMLYQHIQPAHSGKIIAKVVDLQGCKAQDEISLSINRNRRVYLPNVFNPESNQNGTFTINLGNDVRVVKVFEIFDRWGERVYQIQNFAPPGSNVAWDGTLLGREMPAGVYTYYLVVKFIDGEEEIFVGDLTLLR